MMIANVYHDGPTVRGIIARERSSDLYVFELSAMHARWEFKGKVQTYGPFIPADQLGYEHLPQEFYAALDEAWTTGHFAEFPDPFLDNLEVAGA